MPVPRSYHCDAVVLKKSPFGEAGLAVTLFTRGQGKVRAVARGARRSTSKLMGHLEPLTQVQLSITLGRGMDYIGQAQIIDNFSGIKEDLGAVAKALYVAELVDGFGAEASPNQPLYNLTLETLHALNQNPDSEWPLRFFQLHLLRVSGFMPELYQCVECRQPLAPGQHRFSPSMGGALCLTCRPETYQVLHLSLRALKVLRLLHRGTLREAMPLQEIPALAEELKALMGNTVRYWLEREIRSNSFLEHLRSESKRGVYN